MRACSTTVDFTGLWGCNGQMVMLPLWYLLYLIKFHTVKSNRRDPVNIRTNYCQSCYSRLTSHTNRDVAGLEEVDKRGQSTRDEGHLEGGSGTVVVGAGDRGRLLGGAAGGGSCITVRDHCYV